MYISHPKGYRLGLHYTYDSLADLAKPAPAIGLRSVLTDCVSQLMTIGTYETLEKVLEATNQVHDSPAFDRCSTGRFSSR